MSTDERTRLGTLLALTDADHTASMLELVAARAVTTLAVTGAAVTVLSHLGDQTPPGRGLVHATDGTSHRLDDLQLTVGEGPCLAAFHNSAPVMVADLAAGDGRWPGFAPAARRFGAAAVFSFPLRVGVVRLGTLDTYRDTVGPLDDQQHGDALLLARAATQALLDELSGDNAQSTLWLGDIRTPVHEATGMVAAQLGTTMDVALLRLRAHAYIHGLPVTEVATQITGRTLRFSPDTRA
ncbi:GAF domain-containing protein [Saccharopolyspora halophila]|uniref:GAF domain-containing protein n=2 Tax=Saccharopolyspora halophila TaxID=405551 RepID=A0ABP5TKE4_9PSEU